MLVVGINSFDSKSGDHYKVLECVKPWAYPQGKKGYEVKEFWFKNSTDESLAGVQLGDNIDVYFDSSNRPCKIVDSDDHIDISF